MRLRDSLAGLRRSIADVVRKTENDAQVLPVGSTVRFGRPDPQIVPAGLEERLVHCFTAHPEVERAYVGMWEIVSAGTPPEIVIAVETKGDFSSIAGEAARSVNDLPKTNFKLCFTDANIGLGKDLTKNAVLFYAREGA